jgi:hypothetical protein
MKTKLNELRLDAGIARIENQQWLCVLDKETGMMIDPLIGLEKFAELIVAEVNTVLEKRFMGDLNREDMEVRRCIADVKKHFGVEE